MRRTLILLAVILAGTRGDRAAEPAPPAPELHELTDAADSGPHAFLRGGSTLPILAWQDGSGSPPRSSPRALLEHPTRWPAHSASGRGAAASRERTHREHAVARLRLLNAGRSAFHTATPPPFRSV